MTFDELMTPEVGSWLKDGGESLVRNWRVSENSRLARFGCMGGSRHQPVVAHWY